MAVRDADLAARDADLATRDAELASERARRVELEEQVAKLTEAVRELRAILGRNSSNSNKRPSNDPPGAGGSRPKKKVKRRRGGQKGHLGSHRALLSPEFVDDFVDLYPAECESCWEPLPQIPDAFPRRYQYELAPLAAHTTEWHRHAVLCPCCGYKTQAKYDAERIPRYAFGPRLMAVVAMLTRVYHLSRRQTMRLLEELLGVRMSLAWVSAIEKRVVDAVEPAADEAWAKAQVAAIKHADGTSWLRAGVMLSLWVIATTAATGVQDAQRRPEGDAAKRPLRPGARDPGERPSDGAEVLGDETATDLMGTPGAQVRLLLGARWTGRRDRPGAAGGAHLRRPCARSPAPAACPPRRAPRRARSGRT